MKTTIALACLLFLSLFSNAQNIPTDTSAPVVAYWRLGEKKTIRITKTVEKTKGGNQESFATNSCEAVITVKDSVKEGYTLQWKYTSLGNGEKPLQSMPEIYTLFKNLVVVYKTNDVGSFSELVNYAEVKKLIDASFSSFSKTAKDTSLAFRNAMKEMQAVFKSRESIEQLILKDISLFHTPFGLEYTLRKQEQEAELPNFLGGDPWPAVQSFQLTALKPKQDMAQIAIGQTIDEVKAATILKAFFTKLSTGKKIQEDEFPSYISIKDHHEFDVALSSGWIRRAYLQRTAQTDDIKKTETLEIIMK